MLLKKKRDGRIRKRQCQSEAKQIRDLGKSVYSEDSESDSPDVSDGSDDIMDDTLSDQSLDELKHSF